MTHQQIENWFQEGKVAAEIDFDKEDSRPCPYAEGTLANHWWTRGFAYESRLLQLHETQRELQALRRSIFPEQP